MQDTTVIKTQNYKELNGMKVYKSKGDFFIIGDKIFQHKVMQ